MTIRDMMDQYAGQYVAMEVFRPKGKKISLGFDFIEEVERWDDAWKVDIVHSGLYGEQEYNEKLLANTASSFSDFYDTQDKVLVILLDE